MEPASDSRKTRSAARFYNGRPRNLVYADSMQTNFTLIVVLALIAASPSSANWPKPEFVARTRDTTLERRDADTCALRRKIAQDYNRTPRRDAFVWDRARPGARRDRCDALIRRPRERATAAASRG